MNNTFRSVLRALAPILAGGFAWFSLPSALLALAGADGSERLLAVRSGVATWLVAEIATHSARAICELASVRYPQTARMVTHLGAVALGVLAAATHPYFEAVGVSVSVLSAVAAVSSRTHLDARMRPRWRWLPLGLFFPSLVAFVAGGVGSGLLSGVMTVYLLYLLCYWLPLASAFALLVTRSSTP